MSNKRFKKSIFVFRRDLRLHDNTGLIRALNSSERLYCLYFLDTNILKSKSEYSSIELSIPPIDHYKRIQKRDHLLFFLATSLLDLQTQFANLDKKDNGHKTALKSKTKETPPIDSNIPYNKSKMSFLLGDPPILLDKILRCDNEIEAVFVNRDYYPYSLRRDGLIQEVCHKNKVNFVVSNDLLLNEPEEIMSSSNKPFKIFSHYYNIAIKRKVKEETSIRSSMLNKVIDSPIESKVLQHKLKNYSVIDLKTFFNKLALGILNTHRIAFLGGRRGYLQETADLASRLAKYNEGRNVLEKRSTSNISAYLRFGICSIREAYFTFQSLLKDFDKYVSIQRQLYWRDFFTYIGFHFPHVFGRSFKEKYSEADENSLNRLQLQWRNDPKEFDKWCNGRTGFPIVDAGMRELNDTGYMHNRARLIAASFLVKDLHIDWRYGERYFALKLLDYDPGVNNGNWQWVASTGCDAAPYFRIFNPWLQQKKFDPDCAYIKKWIPEIRTLSSKTIHEWYKQFENGKKGIDSLRTNIDNMAINNEENLSYPKPIVDHHVETQLTRQLYGV